MVDIPQYHDFFQSVLDALKEIGGSGRNPEILKEISRQKSFSKEQIEILHGKSGGITEIDYRIGWARSYLKEYGYIQNNEVGFWSLTDKGRNEKNVDKDEIIKHYKKSKELVFGPIENIKIGQIFDSRKELSHAGLHKPLQAGIWGSDEGACSIVLSKGYEDDVDTLETIFYTGQGGRDPDTKKQISDQEFIRGNKGLMLSSNYEKPVRVIRGYQTENGPETGYRYDGLYNVKSFERVKGKSGFYICRFILISENSFKEIEDILKGTFKQEYLPPERNLATINKPKRNVKLSEKIKNIYNFRCQVCNVLLDTPYEPIAIAAHIKGLGIPHNGPDVIENMLCLCPNHHSMLDRYAFYIDPKSLQVKNLEELENRKININRKHKLNKEFLEYHYDCYRQINPKK